MQSMLNDRGSGRPSIWVKLLAVAMACTAAPAARPIAAAKPLTKVAPAKVAANRDEEIYGQLGKCWQAFYAGTYPAAAAQSEAMTKVVEPRLRWVAAEARWLLSRCYWASDNPQARATAQQLWKQIEQVYPGSATKTRLQIAKAMVLEAAAQAPAVKSDLAAGKLKAAIDTLEPLLKTKPWNMQEIEAALVLSNLYANRSVGRFDDAKKTLQYVVTYLSAGQSEKNAIGLELPPGLEKPHIAEAKRALAHLKYDKNEGLAEFEAAEKLRKAEKYAEAQNAYLKIVHDLPQSEFAARSDLHIGD